MRLPSILIALIVVAALSAEADEILGGSCSTVTPGDNYACCQQKAQNGDDDSWCQGQYPELYNSSPAPMGSSCSTVTPSDREACCQNKADSGQDDSWCLNTYPDLFSPPGSSCSTVTPRDRKKCCKQKAQAGTSDDWCQQTYPELYNNTDSGSSYTNYPWTAYIESPAAPNGTCGGSLIAPGYVLTAAQCVVFGNGSAAGAGNVSVWVNGSWYEVDTVLVNQDKAQFMDFTNPTSQNSWDLAMLALTNNSDAQYVALPLSDTPQNGDWLTTTAWDKPKSTVQTAQVPAWDGCSTDYQWADDFCAGGSGFLQSCPADKGSPVLKGSTQVGLTSGPGCNGTSSNYGYFLKLADKDILEQISVWLNSRGTTGLDANIQSWLVEANTYLYGR